jgi:hypothetical protein
MAEIDISVLNRQCLNRCLDNAPGDVPGNRGLASQAYCRRCQATLDVCHRGGTSQTAKALPVIEDRKTTSRSSLLFHSKVSAPTSFFSRAFFCARRAALFVA